MYFVFPKGGVSSRLFIHGNKGVESKYRAQDIIQNFNIIHNNVNCVLSLTSSMASEIHRGILRVLSLERKANVCRFYMEVRISSVKYLTYLLAVPRDALYQT